MTDNLPVISNAWCSDSSITDRLSVMPELYSKYYDGSQWVTYTRTPEVYSFIQIDNANYSNGIKIYLYCTKNLQNCVKWAFSSNNNGAGCFYPAVNQYSVIDLTPYRGNLNNTEIIKLYYDGQFYIDSSQPLMETCFSLPGEKGTKLVLGKYSAQNLSVSFKQPIPYSTDKLLFSFIVGLS